MAGYAPSFLGNTDSSVSGFSVDQSVKNHLQDVEDDIVQEDEIEDPPLSPHQGETTPLRDQPSPPPIRRPLCPPGPESLISSRGPEGISTLMHADPLATILNPRKCKTHSEVFSALDGPEVMIQTMLSSEVQAWLWPKECYIHQRLRDGLLRKPVPS